MDTTNWYDDIYLGSCPIDEDGLSVGVHSSRDLHREAMVYRRQLARQFKHAPAGLELMVKAHNHDFGRYYAVHARYSAKDEEAAEFALHIEANLPKEWSDEARQQLQKGGKSDGR